jgi:hypothetical protein
LHGGEDSRRKHVAERAQQGGKKQDQEAGK